MPRVKPLFIVHDNRARITAGSPIAAWNDVDITRQLEQDVNNPKKESRISQYPDDFDLYEIGIIDEETGKIEGHEEPRHIRRLSTLVQHQ